MEKVVYLGRSQGQDVFSKISFINGNLSITGVIGPRGNGSAQSCGQIHGTIIDEPAWTPTETIETFYEIWKRWHLNDMRVGCAHQRDLGWDKKRIDANKPLDTYGKHFAGQTAPSWNMLTWVTPKEHPEGLLTKPCPICGHKYGTSWLREEVPTDIIKWLFDLPSSPIKPTWI